MPKLKPPKNFGVRIPQVCALCKWFEAMSDGEHWFCQRNYLYQDYGAMGWKHFKRGCDRWVDKLAGL